MEEINQIHRLNFKVWFRNIGIKMQTFDITEIAEFRTRNIFIWDSTYFIVVQGSMSKGVTLLDFYTVDTVSGLKVMSFWYLYQSTHAYCTVVQEKTSLRPLSIWTYSWALTCTVELSYNSSHISATPKTATTNYLPVSTVKRSSKY